MDNLPMCLKVDMDLNSLDNTTQAVTRVGYLAFLPVALKE